MATRCWGTGVALRHQGTGLKQLRGVDLTIVALDGASDDGGGRVATDVVLRRGRHGTRDVAGLEGQDAQDDNRQSRHDAGHAAKTVFLFVSHRLPPSLVDAVSGHELAHQEGTQGVVLLLGVEANLSSGTLGGVSHLGLRVGRGIPEQVTLRQHAGSDGGAGIAQLADVRLLGEGVDAEIGVGVTARLAVDFLDRILENYFLILGHSVKWVLGVKAPS